MTLIIFNKCTNGLILILDRKETDTTGIGQTTKKYFRSQNDEFILALAGSTLRIDTIFTALTLDKSIDSKSITTQLDEIIKRIPIISGDLMESSGILLIHENDSWVFHNVWFSNTQRSIVENDPRFKCYGDGSTLADYLIRKFDLQNMTWQDAVQYLIAIVQEVSTIIDTVGSLEKFGFDVIVFTDKNEIKSCTMYAQTGSQSIDCNFTPSKIHDMQDLMSSKVIELEKHISPSKLIMSEQSTIKSNIIIPKFEPIIDTFQLNEDEQVFDLEYSITNGKIIKISRDPVIKTLIITLSASGDGLLTITIPRQLLDAKKGIDDDEFFVMCDGEEITFNEIKTNNQRILTIEFPKDAEEIEIIGTEPYATTDKNVYTYGDKIMITATSFAEKDDDAIELVINNESGESIYQKLINTNSLREGSFQEIISIEGKNWSKPNQNYTIIIKFSTKSVQIPISTDDFAISVLFDQKVYSWRDKVSITVIAPELVNDHSKIESIGNTEDQQITISTSKGSLNYYKLQETGNGTGIFTGSVTLTGFKDHEAIPHDHTKDKRGDTIGKGSTDGYLACSNSDYFVLKIKTSTKSITNSAIIRWNIGELQWINSSYPQISKGEIRLVDPDINLHPDEIDEVEIKVWSDTDAKGITLVLKETEKDSGIFKGIVYFTTDETNSPKLRVSEGDTVVAEYLDKTLPEPYTTRDELRLSATTMIGTLLPPLERISIDYAFIIDLYGNHLAQISTGQPVLLQFEITNNQRKSQNFACILQVQNEQSVSVSLSSISGTLEANQKLKPAMSWIPSKAGEYQLTLFIWEAIDNPTSISSPLTLKINAVGDDKEVPPLKSIQLKTPDIISEGITKSFDTVIKIPRGSSEPSCHDTNECYIPFHAKVKVNDSVAWINEDTASHTVTSGTPDSGADGEFDSGLCLPQNSFAMTFKKKGIYPYFCLVHPWQIGEIEVE